jgi:hypothetical protein
VVNPSTAQARVLVVDELIRGGVRDVVLCPGSRNAPLAFALHDATRAGAHDVVQKDGRFGTPRRPTECSFDPTDQPSYVPKRAIAAHRSPNCCAARHRGIAVIVDGRTTHLAGRLKEARRRLGPLVLADGSDRHNQYGRRADFRCRR